MIEIPLPDGTIVEVDTDDPQTAARTAQAYVQQTAAIAPLFGGGVSAPSLGVDWDAYLRANPDVAAAINDPRGRGKKLIRDAARAGQTPAEHHYERYGRADGRAPPPQIGAAEADEAARIAAVEAAGGVVPGTVDGGDVLDLFEANPLLDYAEEDALRRRYISDDTFDGEEILTARDLETFEGLRRDERADTEALVDSQAGDLRALYQDQLGDRRAEIEAAFRAQQAADAAARDAVRGEADAGYGRSINLLTEDLGVRRGISEREIAAWLANSDIEQSRANDLVFSRGGVSGQIGATRRGVAQVGQDYARDRAIYRGGRERADYDPFADGRLRAEDLRTDRTVGAERDYGQALRSAEQARGSRQIGALEAFLGSDAQAVAQQQQGRRTALDAYYASANANQNTAATQRRDSFGRSQQRRFEIGESYGRTRDALIGDQLGYFDADSVRGLNAANQIGRNAAEFSSTVSDINQDRADNEANRVRDRANINAQLWSGLGSAAGSAFAAFGGGRSGGGGGGGFGRTAAAPSLESLLIPRAG